MLDKIVTTNMDEIIRRVALEQGQSPFEGSLYEMKKKIRKIPYIIVHDSSLIWIVWLLLWKFNTVECNDLNANMNIDVMLINENQLLLFFKSPIKSVSIN